MAFKAQPEEPTGLALRWLAATLCEDEGDGARPHGSGDKANVVDFTVRRQRRVVRSTFSAELNGMVDSAEREVIFTVYIALDILWYSAGSGKNDRQLEGRLSYPPLDLCVDARAVYDSVAATDVCEPAGSSLKLHLISVRDWKTHGLIRKLFWVDAKDMLADGLTNGDIDRTLLHNASNDCKYTCVHEALPHEKKKDQVGSATVPPKEA